MAVGRRSSDGTSLDPENPVVEVTLALCSGLHFDASMTPDMFGLRKKNGNATDFDSVVRRLAAELAPKGVRVDELSDDALQVGKIRMNLENSRLRWDQHEEEDREPWLRAVLTEMLSSDDRTDPTHGQLRPGVRSVQTALAGPMMAAAQGDHDPSIDIPYRRIAGDLCWVVIVDNPYTMQIANNAALAAMGLGFDEALDIAFRNDASADDTAVPAWAVMKSEDGSAVASAQGGSDYALNSIFTDGALAEVAIPELRTAREFVVFAPTRTDCWVVDVDDVQGIALAAQFVQKSLSEPNLVSLAPVVGGRNGWRPFVVDVGHPAHDALTDVGVLDRLVAYESQKPLLQAVMGEEVFVSTYTAIGDEETGRPTAYAVWGQDVVSLLPKVEHLSLYTEQRDHLFVPWDRAVEILGHRMTQTQHDPVRYFVDSFPTPEEWAALQPHSLT